MSLDKDMEEYALDTIRSWEKTLVRMFCRCPKYIAANGGHLQDCAIGEVINQAKNYEVSEK